MVSTTAPSTAFSVVNEAKIPDQTNFFQSSFLFEIKISFGVNKSFEFFVDVEAV
jgi:hypothetical protein